MPEKEEFVPAKKWLVLVSLALAAVLIFAFAGVLRHTLRTAVPLNPAEYAGAPPQNLAYSFAQQIGGGAVSLRGWACVQGERFETVDNRVVLYNTQDGSYLAIPTAMQLTDEPLSVLGDDINYTYGGFTAYVLLEQLTAGLPAYEICFAYRSNAYNALVHTGQYLKEG